MRQLSRQCFYVIHMAALSTVLLVSLAACGADPGDELLSGNPTSHTTITPTPQATPTPTPPSEQVENKEITLQLSLLGNPGEHTGTYTGEMVDGLPHGQGSFATTSPQGKARTYIGDWEAGHLSGEGRWEHSGSFGARVVARGTYENDLLVDGTLFYGNDLVRYEGTFQGGLPDLDAAARQALVDELDKTAILLERGGDWEWADYLSQIVASEERVEQVVPDATCYLLVYAGGVGSANYFPSYGETLPQPGDDLLVYKYPYAQPDPQTGTDIIFQDLMAVVAQ